MALNNSANTQQLLSPGATPAFVDLTLTNRTAYAVLTGGTTSSNPLQSIASLGTSGQILTSAGAALPTFSNPGASVTVTQFDANGTWTKKTNTKYVQMYLWGSGGSGGSGRQGTTAAAGGGAGGAGGTLVISGLAATFFDTSATVTVGAASTGGAPRTGGAGNGNVGAAGNKTCVGLICTTSNATQGGPAGITGNTAAATNVNSFNYIWNVTGQVNNWDRGTSGGGRPGNGITVTQTAPSGTGMAPTGGGGGAGANSTTERTGGNGMSMKDPSFTNTIIAGGVGGVESGTIAGGAGTNQATGATSNGVFTGGTGGGGGGGQKGGASAGAGGNGGIPGGGGGGGGGSLTGTDSGAGGDSGRGRVIIVEFA